eukprot:gene29432-38526_t
MELLSVKPNNDDTNSSSPMHNEGVSDEKNQPSESSTTTRSGVMKGFMASAAAYMSTNSKQDVGNQDDKPDLPKSAPLETLEQALESLYGGIVAEKRDYRTVKYLQDQADVHLKKLNGKKSPTEKEVEDKDKVKLLLKKLKIREREFKATGTDKAILERIHEQDVEDKHRMLRNPILSIVEPESYQSNEYREMQNPGYLIVPYIIICGGTTIVVSIAIAMDFARGEVYKQITIVMFVANMISTAMSIIALELSEVRISSLEGENWDIVLFSIGLALILTAILLLPWTYILQTKYVPGFDACNVEIVTMASTGMIVLYSFVSCILINSLIKMSRVLKTYIHDGRKVVCSNTYYDLEKVAMDTDPQNRVKYNYHVLYKKVPLLIQSEFLSSLNKIKRFQTFLKYALLFSLPELALSIVLTTILVFKVKQLSVLTLLFINCSMYPFSLLLVSSIIFNNKIRDFEAQREIDTDLIIDFMGVEITQSWIFGLASPLYTFLVKLYGMSGAAA